MIMILKYDLEFVEIKNQHATLSKSNPATNEQKLNSLEYCQKVIAAGNCSQSDAKKIDKE